jgi:YD repeat-containing protein
MDFLSREKEPELLLPSASDCACSELKQKNHRQRLDEERNAVFNQSADLSTYPRKISVRTTQATAEDANGNTTTNAYDALNRITKAVYQDGTSSSFAYDKGGAAAHLIGRLRSITEAPVGGSTNEMLFTYDVHGRVSLKENELTGQSYRADYKTTTGKLISETYPSGMLVGYRYDKAGQMDEITVNKAAFITGVKHEPFGPAKGWKWAVGGERYARTFDLDGRLTEYPLITGSARKLVYDNDSRVHTLRDSAASQIIGYDPNSRVNSYTGPFGSGNQSEMYDNDGNRTIITTSVGTETDTIDPSNNQITQRALGSSTVPYGYDADGNTETMGSFAYGYDTRSRMTSAAGVES